jgi:hypothetical protein
MNEYSVTVTLVDNFVFKVTFDSFDDFDTYLYTIDHKLNNYVSNSGAFIDLGNKEVFLVPIQKIKIIHSHGYALADSEK